MFVKIEQKNNTKNIGLMILSLEVSRAAFYNHFVVPSFQCHLFEQSPLIFPGLFALSVYPALVSVCMMLNFVSASTVCSNFYQLRFLF